MLETTNPIVTGAELEGVASIAWMLLGLFFAGHAAFLILTFLLHFYDSATRRGQTPASPWSYVRALATEWWFSLAYVLSAPFGYLPAAKPRPSRDGSPQLPVLLVHGYILNRACWFATYWRLRRLGYRHVYTVNIWPVFGPVPEMVPGLVAKIRTISSHHEGRPVQIVAHSLGGILIRRALQDEPDLPVHRIVTLGTPHSGTTMAYLGVTPASTSLRPHSPLLANLPASPPVPFTSVYTLMDNLVIPAENARLEGPSAQLSKMGHIGLLYATETFQVLAAALDPPTPRP